MSIEQLNQLNFPVKQQPDNKVHIRSRNLHIKHSKQNCWKVNKFLSDHFALNSKLSNIQLRLGNLIKAYDSDI